MSLIEHTNREIKLSKLQVFIIYQVGITLKYIFLGFIKRKYFSSNYHRNTFPINKLFHVTLCQLLFDQNKNQKLQMRNHIFSPEMNKPAVAGNQIRKQILLV